MTFRIEMNQVVNANREYLSCEQGDFEENDFVMCKHKLDVIEDTVMFFAYQISVNNESSV